MKRIKLTETLVEFKEYRKLTLTKAVQINEPFEVDTLEGRSVGKAGDWLAEDAGGRYPIDGTIFKQNYAEV